MVSVTSNSVMGCRRLPIHGWHAIGGVAGSLLASRLVTMIGKGAALFGTILTGVIAFALTGLTPSAPLVWAMFTVMAFAGTVWNVVTVSLRQRVVPDQLPGRVNSVYRFFGWGMMSTGARWEGGALVSVAQPLTRTRVVAAPSLPCGRDRPAGGLRMRCPASAPPGSPRRRPKASMLRVDRAPRQGPHQKRQTQGSRGE